MYRLTRQVPLVMISSIAFIFCCSMNFLQETGPKSRAQKQRSRRKCFFIRRMDQGIKIDKFPGICQADNPENTALSGPLRLLFDITLRSYKYGHEHAPVALTRPANQLFFPFLLQLPVRAGLFAPAGKTGRHKSFPDCKLGNIQNCRGSSVHPANSLTDRPERERPGNADIVRSSMPEYLSYLTLRLSASFLSHTGSSHENDR